MHLPRAARPSDIYRLPEHSRPSGRSPLPPEPPQRRFPAWVGVAGLLAAVLIISGLVRGATQPTSGDVPLVDVVSEDQAIAALRLYGAQVTTIDALRERADIYATPGPRDAAGVAGQGAQDTQAALDAARDLVNPDPLVDAYAASDEHAVTAERLSDAARLADTIALLASAHDSLYAGAGSIPLDEAYTRINGLLSGGRAPEAIRMWAAALVEQMEDRNRAEQAAHGRTAAQRLWGSTVKALEPAALAELQTYINGLPAVTVDGLRGHPVAGPALKRLEQHARQVG